MKTAFSTYFQTPHRGSQQILYTSPGPREHGIISWFSSAGLFYRGIEMGLWRPILIQAFEAFVLFCSLE